MPISPPRWAGCTSISASDGGAGTRQAEAATRSGPTGRRAGGMTGTTGRRSILKAAAAVPAAGGLPWRSARAQAANTIRIALLCDFSGTYRDVTGPTGLACIRQAVAEFNNRGLNVEVVFGDNQNR